MTLPPDPVSTSGGADRERRPSALFVIVAVGLLSVSAIRLARLAWMHDPRVHVPAPVAFVLAFVMLAAAAAVVLKVLGRDAYLAWLVVPVLLGMAVTSGWIGLYGSERYCSSRGPLWLPMPSCHSAFTAAALILLLMAAMAARDAWRRRLSESRKPPRAG